MSAGGFWRRSRARPEPEYEEAATLTVTDRCGARAYVRVLLPSRLELLFCAHHNRKHAEALAKIVVQILPNPLTFEFYRR